ncbi:hypothetical protein L4X63_12845 [Geomonas sp. Red32]|uniref:hypothetical protein n=1 Tax=Geomonas sp. Red32 TaxID=2912856 RepID=UPI00202CF471|nr:hypothetical protein [Geomonas sp. Red32]
MERYLPHLFVVNFVLTLVDASIGYHAAPLLVRLTNGGEEAEESATRTVRSLLAAVVGSYMFLNCLFYFNPRPSLLLTVTGFIVVDMVCQLWLRRKMEGEG